MELIEEYLNQQKWREWEKYISHIPVKSSDRVVDLGCSVGAVARLLSKLSKSTLGVDINKSFIDYCRSQSRGNDQYLCGDISKLDLSLFGAIDGVWASHSLSYLANPEEYLKSLYTHLNSNGWIAMVDIDCFISGNMPTLSLYKSRVLEFEKESYKSGVYDFNFGSKMEAMLVRAGFEIIHVDNDVSDIELNSDTPAPTEVIENWRSRLGRLNGLEMEISAPYNELSSELLEYIGSDYRCKTGSVRYVVARKI